MCGLVGVAYVDPQPKQAWLHTAIDTLEHRGPDDGEEWWSDDGKVEFLCNNFEELPLAMLSKWIVVDSFGV